MQLVFLFSSLIQFKIRIELTSSISQNKPDWQLFNFPTKVGETNDISLMYTLREQIIRVNIESLFSSLCGEFSAYWMEKAFFLSDVEKFFRPKASEEVKNLLCI